MTDRIIRFGLDAVDSVGVDVAHSIATEAPYASLPDFLEKNPAAGKRAVTALIAAGAFDSLHGQDSRATLAAVLPSVMAVSLAGRKLAALGQPVPFAGFHIDLSGPVQSSADRLAAEHHVLGCYVSGHPSYAYELPTGEGVAAGLVTSIQHKISKRGDPWAIMIVESPSSSTEILWFPQSWHLLDGYADSDVVSVQVQVRDDQVVGRQIKRLQPSRPASEVVHADASALDLVAIRARLAELDSDRPVHLVLSCGNRTTTFVVVI